MTITDHTGTENATAKKVLLDFFSHFEDDAAQCDNWAEVILADFNAARIAVVQLPEHDDTPDIGLVLDAVTEGLGEIGGLVRVAEDDDDPGTPGILTPSGAVCMYDLNNEINSAFQGFIGDEPQRVHELGIALLAATHKTGIESTDESHHKSS